MWDFGGACESGAVLFSPELQGLMQRLQSGVDSMGESILGRSLERESRRCSDLQKHEPCDYHVDEGAFFWCEKTSFRTKNLAQLNPFFGALLLG
jgi:hypothetical protein